MTETNKTKKTTEGSYCNIFPVAVNSNADMSTFQITLGKSIY